MSTYSGRGGLQTSSGSTLKPLNRKVRPRSAKPFRQQGNPEIQKMIDATLVIEKDLHSRCKTFGSDNVNTIECLKYFINTCNDYAMTILLYNENEVAARMLLNCDSILTSNVFGNYPFFKHVTSVNLAHIFNRNGNVRLSLKYLSRALEDGQQCQEPVSLVETYLNIANAHAHIGDLQLALNNVQMAITNNEVEISSIIERLNSNEEMTISEKHHLN